MEGFTLLVVFCVAMFGGAYGAGSLPLLLSLNVSRLRWVTIFGAGLLVGTALVVIIPEGIAMHYESQQRHAEVQGVHLPPGVKLLGLRSSSYPHGGTLSDDVGGEAPPGAAAREAAAGGGHAHGHAGHTHRRRLAELVSAVNTHAMPHVAAPAAPPSTAASSSAAAASGVEEVTSLTAMLRGSAATDAAALSAAAAKAGGAAHSRTLAADVEDASVSGLEGADGGEQTEGGEGPHDAVDAPPGDATEGEREGAEDDHDGHAHGVDSHEHPGHWQIGAALVLGFAFQLVVDKIAGGLHSHGGPLAPAETGPAGRKLDTGAAGGGAAGEAGLGAAAPSLVTLPGGGGGGASDNTAAKSKAALAGLVVHAMVDGMALAAAVKEGDSALGGLVFAAIMLHKAPGAFGMTSYLLHAGISKAGVRSRLVLFSLAAPTGALLTYWLLSLRLFVYKQEMVALCLLFSGGTFLYVATAHVLPEITQSDNHITSHDDDDAHTHHSGGHGGHSHGGQHGGLKWPEVWTLVAGLLLPLFLNVGHGH